MFRGSGSEIIQSLATDVNNSLIAAGYSTQAFSVDGNSVGVVSTFTYHVAKFTSTGTLQWISSHGGSTNLYNGIRCSVDPFGSVLLTGDFRGANINFQVRLLTTTTSADMFYSKLNAAGVIQFVNSYGTSNPDDKPASIIGDAKGNIFVFVFTFYSYMTFHPFLGWIPAVDEDTYIIQAITSGTQITAAYRTTVGTAGREQFLYSVLNSKGDLFVQGVVTRTITIDGRSVTAAPLNVPDIFVAKHIINCDPCQAGTWSSTIGATSPSTCISCPRGTFSTTVAASSNTTCTLCPSSTFGDTFAATSCKLCLPGTFSNATGLTKCFDCVEGFVAPNSGATACQACLPGQYMNAKAQPTCKVCNPGTYNPHFAAVNVTQCIACPLNSYSTDFGASNISSCLSCPNRTYTLANLASISQESCIAENTDVCVAGDYFPPGAKYLEHSAPNALLVDILKRTSLMLTFMVLRM